MTTPNMKDLSFTFVSNYDDTSKFEVFYGEKVIATGNIYDSDIAKLKLVAVAVQAEIMKDIINKTP